MAVFFKEPFRHAGYMLRPVIAMGGVVIGAHVVVHVEMLLGPANDVGVVGGDTGLHPPVPNHPDHRRNLVQLALGVKKIHDPAVNVTSLRAAVRRSRHTRRVIAHLGAGLGEPGNGAPLIPILQKHAHDMVIGSRNHGRHPEVFRVAQGVFDRPGGEITAHFLIPLDALVREAAKRIAAHDKAADLYIANLDTVHRSRSLYGNPVLLWSTVYHALSGG